MIEKFINRRNLDTSKVANFCRVHGVRWFWASARSPGETPEIKENVIFRTIVKLTIQLDHICYIRNKNITKQLDHNCYIRNNFLNFIPYIVLNQPGPTLHTILMLIIPLFSFFLISNTSLQR